MAKKTSTLRKTSSTRQAVTLEVRVMGKGKGGKKRVLSSTSRTISI